MDNNFNQQAPQQTVGQPVYQQVPQQPVGQPVYQQAPKKPSNINVMGLIALICSSVGLLMTVVGSILTCSCSASKSYDAESTIEMKKLMIEGNHSMSLVMILAIVGAVIAIVGVVFGILAIKDKKSTVKAGKMAYIAIAVGVFAVMYGILPVITICGYNCSLDANTIDQMNYWYR